MSEVKRNFDNKQIRKTIRFSPTEYEKIETQLNDLNIDFATFARKALLKQKIKLPIEQELIYEINKIGNNLNQIARAVNKHDDRISILTELVEIEKQLKKLL